MGTNNKISEDFAPECLVNCLWSSKISKRFNSLCVGQLFREESEQLVTGGEDGVVCMFLLPRETNGQQVKLQPSKELETKGGPIQELAIHDISRLGGRDLIVADSRGMVTVFCKGQILSRKAVSEHCITCLRVQQDSLGHVAVVTGDSEGHIHAFSLYSPLWQLRLTDIKHLKGLSSTPSVKSVLITDLTDNMGVTNSYVIVADDHQHLCILHQGHVIMVAQTPSNISAMCKGHFVEADQFESVQSPGGAAPAHTNQHIALGSVTGAVYIMANFEVYTEEIGSVHLPITHLLTLQSTSQKLDALLCAGHFNALCVLRGGKHVARFEMPSWINSMVATPDNSNSPQVIVGCQDNSIHGMKIEVS